VVEKGVSSIVVIAVIVVISVCAAAIIGYYFGTRNQSTDVPPNKPLNLSPATRQITTSVTISCFENDNDRDKINVFFYNNSNKSPIDNVWISSGRTAEVIWSGLTRGQTYTFYARGQDNNGKWGEKSDTQSFLVNSLPAVPTSWTDLGLNLDNHTPPITWTKGIDADGDTVTTCVYVGTTSTPTTLETSTTEATANLGNTVILNDGGIYYYRLRSWDGYEWSDYTPADKFCMHAPPGTPRLAIFIQNDAYFNLENGVNGGGSGTILDPYIVENWAVNGVRIENTSKYFVIRNCLIENGREGIYLDNVINGKAENNNCKNNKFGIRLNSSSNNNLTGNYCENNTSYGYGISLEYSSNNILTGNICKYNYYEGILLFSSSNNILTNNTSDYNSDYGIHLDTSSNYNTLTNNTCNSNLWPGIYLQNSSNNSLTNNTCENNLGDGILLEYSSNNIITNNACYNSTEGIYLETSDNNILDSNNCFGSKSDGIYLENSNHNTLTGNTCENNYGGTKLFSGYGIYLDSSSNNNLSSNTCLNSSEAGIRLYDSSNYNTIDNNNCENSSYGIWLYLSSNYNILTNNTCEKSYYGIALGFSSNYNNLDNNNCGGNYNGIFLDSASSNNNIENNICENNIGDGIRLSGSSSNTLTGNACKYNEYGIYVEISSNNIVILNYLLNNTENNAYDASSNAWDNNGRGNYWSDWQPPEHPDANGDGIVDEPRSIAGTGNQDNYPLVLGS
jgi:parallel beta-helix repeat protein